MSPDGDIPPNTIQMLENVQHNFQYWTHRFAREGTLGGTAENGVVAARRKTGKGTSAGDLHKDVALRLEPDGLVISLREVGFFSSGSAELRPAAIPALRRVTQVLLERPYEIRIEGHTIMFASTMRNSLRTAGTIW